MCYGEIVSSPMIAARRAFKCQQCERIMPKGEEHLAHQIESYEEIRDNVEPTRSTWRLCKRCTVEWWAALDLTDGMYCPTDARGHLRSEIDDGLGSRVIIALKSARDFWRKRGVFSKGRSTSGTCPEKTDNQHQR